MRVTCKYCGGPHPAFECRKESVQAVSSTVDEVEKVAVRSRPSLGRTISTAEKSGSPKAQHEALGNVAGVTQVAGSGVSPPVTRQAGTQALPVDTNSKREECVGGQNFIPPPPFSTTSAGMVGNEDRQPKFDKKAWMREYMRDHRKGIRRRSSK